MRHKRLLLVLCLILIVAGGYRLALQHGWFSSWLLPPELQQLAQVRDQIAQNSAVLGEMTEQIPREFSKIDQESLSEQGVELWGRGQQVTRQIQDVFSNAVQPLPNEGAQTTLTDRALDYGRYLYCQQVVETYETKRATPKPTPSTAPLINPAN
jgi:ABC-type transporter Mla subunit MlaD